MLKILIAEDEEPIANLMKINLVKAGYKCIWAADGETAADRAERWTCMCSGSKRSWAGKTGL